MFAKWVPRCKVGGPHPHLKDDALVDGKLGDDVGQKEVAMVLGGRVDAVLTQQAGPGEGHQAA